MKVSVKKVDALRREMHFEVPKERVTKKTDEVLSEIVKHDVTGLLVAPNDPVALAGALLKLLGDQKRIDEMGKSARENATSRFSVIRFTQSFEQLLND